VGGEEVRVQAEEEGRGLTGSAVRVSIPGLFMEDQGALGSYHLDKRWDFTLEARGYR
jgi:hypothetical protein